MKDLKQELNDDLLKLNDYIKKNSIKSYLLIACGDNDTYFYNWNFDQLPNVLIGNAEMCVFDLKQYVVNKINAHTISLADLEEQRKKMN